MDDAQRSLEMHFALSFKDDPILAGISQEDKLLQKGSVNQYLNEFERLANRVVGWPACLPPPF
jgi:hypothetical protein